MGATQSELSRALTETALACVPFPLAESLNRFAAASDPLDQRDGLVEVFRTSVRLTAALAFAARVELGAGRRKDPAIRHILYGKLTRDRLDFDDWLSMLASLAEERHILRRLPVLELMFDPDGPVRPAINVLQLGCKPTQLQQVAAARLVFSAWLTEQTSALETWLGAQVEFWSNTLLAVPRTQPKTVRYPQRGAFLMGIAAASDGPWRQVDLCKGDSLPLNQLIAINAAGELLFPLESVLRTRRDTAGRPELYVYDGVWLDGPCFVSWPTGARWSAPDAWDPISRKLFGEEIPLCVPRLEAPKRPFVGLRALEPAEHQLLVGRQSDAESLLNVMTRDPLIVLTGPSGVGKTSFLKAGLLPRLDGMELVGMRPGTRPLERLADGLAGLFAAEGIAATTLTPAALYQSLSGDESTRSVAIDTMLCDLRLACRKVTLVVDSFEDLFVQGIDPSEQRVFALTLNQLSQPGSPVTLLLCLQHEFVELVSGLPLLGKRAVRALVPLRPLNRTELDELLSQSVGRLGYRFEAPDAIAELIDELSAAPVGLVGSGTASADGSVSRDAVGLVQLAGTLLWEGRLRTERSLTMRPLNQLFGPRDTPNLEADTDGRTCAASAMGGARFLSNYADLVMSRLSDAERRAAAALLPQLFGAHHARLIVTESALLSAAASGRDVRRVLDVFGKAGLVRRYDDPDQGSLVEPVHAGLGRLWAAMERWRFEQSDRARISTQLSLAAEAWDLEGRPDRLLWAGERREQLQAWRRRNAAPLAPLEAEFALGCARISRKPGRRQKVRQTTSMWASVVVAVIAALVAIAVRRADQASAVPDRGWSTEAPALEHRQIPIAIDRRPPVPVSRYDLRAVETPWQAFALAFEALTSARSETVRSQLRARLRDWAPAARFELPIRTRSPLEDIISAHRGTLAHAVDQTVALWNLATGETSASLELASEVAALVFSVEGNRVAMRSVDGVVSVWNLDDGSLTRLTEVSEPGDLHFVTEDLLAVGGAAGESALWDVRRSQRIPLEGNRDTAHVITSLGDIVAVASQNGNLRLFDRDGEFLQQLVRRDRAAIEDVRFVTEDLVVVRHRNNRLRTWEATTGDLVDDIRLPSPATSMLVLGPARLLLGTTDGQLLEVNPSDGIESRTVACQLGSVTAVTSFPIQGQERAILSVCSEGEIGIWNDDLTRLALLRWPVQLRDAAIARETGQLVIATDVGIGLVPIANLNLPTSLGNLSASPTASASARDSGDVVAIGDETGQIAVWRDGGHSRPVSIDGRDLGGVVALTVAPTLDMVAAAHRDGSVSVTEQLWQGQSDTGPRSVSHTFASQRSMAIDFSPGARQLAIGGVDGRVSIFSADGWRQTDTLRHGDAIITALLWTDEFLVTGSTDNRILLFDTETLVLTHELLGHADAIRTLTARDGVLVSGSWDGTVRLWTLHADDIGDAGRLIDVLDGHLAPVEQVEFGPDGQLVASASADGTVRIWRRNAPVQVIEASSEAGLGQLAISADGRSLMTLSTDGQLAVFDLPTGRRIVSLNVFDVVGVAEFTESGVLYATESGRVRLLGTTSEVLVESIDRWTNLRTCPDGQTVVAVVPFPASDADAPSDLCRRTTTLGNPRPPWPLPLSR